MHDEVFTIPYIADTIKNARAGHQLPSQAQRNLWIVAINGEEHITFQVMLDGNNNHQTPRGNIISIAVYAEGRAIKHQILEIFAPDLIKSDL